MSLAQLFPDEDYGFRFRFERADPRGFFHPTPRHPELIAQRRHWLETDSGRYAAMLADGEPLLDEAIELARAWGTVEPGFNPIANDPDQPLSRCLALGVSWEPDFLLLKAGPGAAPRLVGGSVCFPSSWSLEEKIGRPIATIHGVVPGLNDALGAQIDAFLTKLRPGVAWLRSNWGLSRSAELNQHPARMLARLDGAIRLEEVWLRVENQALVALPRTNGTLFGIRIVMYPLSEIRKDLTLAQRLARALKTMPEPMAVYKGLLTGRDALIGFLQRRPEG
jgi:hypothetical protein